jgi:hypothetical protein
MNRIVTLLVLGLSLAVIASGWAAEENPTEAQAADPPASQNNETSKQLESLLKERRDTLRRLVDILDAQHRQGFGGQEQEDVVLYASNELFDAELDLATTKTERIAIREKIVANLRQVEKRAEMRVGVTTAKKSLEAKAARLKAEIQLLREKESG